MIAAAQPTLESVLERDALLRQKRNATTTGERSSRFQREGQTPHSGLDLHDGPLQELLLLASDLRLFREQLAGVLGEGRDDQRLRGRIDDLNARLVALEGGLRRISNSVHAGVLTSRPARQIGEILTPQRGIHTSHTGISTSRQLTQPEGDATALSASQRIALLSVLGEALNNIREHGDREGQRGIDVC